MTKSRVIAAYCFVIISFLTLFLRYGYLQLIGHTYFLQQSINNYSSVVASLPVRGSIVDKNGVVLADNTVSYVVAILAKDARLNSKIIEGLAPYVDITTLDKKKFLLQLRNAKNYDWVIIKDGLSDTEIANLTAHIYAYPQINVFAHTKRYYPFAEVYAHSLGYVGRVSNHDKEKMDKKGTADDYLSNDYIGKSGLEQVYETSLRGQLGKKTIRTDSRGNEVGLISSVPAKDGNTARLTIDNNLQQQAWDDLGDNKGAIVALDPQTGGVLAFVSKPSFDPNWFIDGISVDDWDDLTHDPDKPLLNRAIQSIYPPGSTFKPFLGLAGLYLKIRSPEYRFFDIGYLSLPGSKHKFRDNDHPHGLGWIDMTKAIAVSSDTFFYRLALDLGIDRIDQILSWFGFGKKTGIDLPHENSGILPSREWKAKRFAHDIYQKNWLPADTVTVGIGQGFNDYTPLQMAMATSIIANDGIVRKPHFLDKVLDHNGKIVAAYPDNSTRVNIPKGDFEYIKNAMEQVVKSGTAKQISYGLKYTLAGKTGTAQVVSTEHGGRKPKFAGKRFHDHAWFVAFAPVDKPKIVIAVLVENGGWGTTSAVIARKVLDYYLLDDGKLSSAKIPVIGVTKVNLSQPIIKHNQNNMGKNNASAENMD